MQQVLRVLELLCLDEVLRERDKKCPRLRRGSSAGDCRLVKTLGGGGRRKAHACVSFAWQDLQHH